MKKFYFNTGVRPENGIGLYADQEWINGVKQIPFYVKDIPDNAQFVFAADNPNLPEAKQDSFIVRKMYNTSMVSDYAYFKVK